MLNIGLRINFCKWNIGLRITILDCWMLLSGCKTGFCDRSSCWQDWKTCAEQRTNFGKWFLGFFDSTEIKPFRYTGFGPRCFPNRSANFKPWPISSDASSAIDETINLYEDLRSEHKLLKILNIMLSLVLGIKAKMEWILIPNGVSR